MSTIYASCAFNYTTGTGDSVAILGALQSTQSGTGVLVSQQTIGTTAEALVLTDLANVSGGLFLKNNDATNYVEVDSANTFDKFPQKIPPGGFVFLGAQSTTIYAKANTAACILTIAAAAG